MLKHSLRVLALCMLAFHAGHLPAGAQATPGKATQIVAGFPPGGTVDLVARTVAHGLSAKLERTFIVENKTGATGTLAASHVARSDPDGHTLLLVPGGHALYGATFKTLPFDPVESFTWISNIVTIPFFMSVSAKSDIKSLPDLIAKAKTTTESERLKFGSVGPGSPHHLGVELLALATGVKFLHVPYRGEGPLLTGLLGSEIDFAIFTPTQVLGQLQSGTVRAIAVTTRTRSSRLPEVATVQEALSISDYDIGSWFALAGPAGLAGPTGIPQPGIYRLIFGLHKVLRSPEAATRLAAVGGDITLSPALNELRDRVMREQEMWRNIVEAAGVPKQ
jgi:tripartite-type tricarboxylate transporter receptor subunit TctC